jgi:hypothetical protein
MGSLSRYDDVHSVINLDVPRQELGLSGKGMVKTCIIVTMIPITNLAIISKLWIREKTEVLNRK